MTDSSTGAGIPPTSPTAAAGTVAAPLLGGITFALVALVLQLHPEEVRWRDTALFLFVAAALAFVTTVQAAMWDGRYGGSRWAALTRWSYDLGVLLLIAAVAILLIPPGSRSHIGAMRLSTVALLGLGFVAELCWIGFAAKRQHRGRKELRRIKREMARRAVPTAPGKNPV